MKKLCLMCSISLIICTSYAMEKVNQQTVQRYAEESLKKMQPSCVLSSQSGKWTCATNFLHLETLRSALRSAGLPTAPADQAVQQLLARCPATTQQKAARLITQNDLVTLKQCKQNAQGICKTGGPGSKFFCSEGQRFDCSMQNFRIQAARTLSQSSQSERQ